MSAILAGGGLAAGGAYLANEGVEDRKDATNAAIDRRAGFTESLAPVRQQNLMDTLGGASELQTQRQDLLSQGVGAVAGAGPVEGSGIQDLTNLRAIGGGFVPALQAGTPDQQRVARQQQALLAPIVRSQHLAAGQQLEAGQRNLAQQQALRQTGLDLQGADRDLGRLQDDYSLSSADLDLLDYLNNLEAQRQIQAAQGVGTEKIAAGGALAGIGGSLLGGGIGGLF